MVNLVLVTGRLMLQNLKSYLQMIYNLGVASCMVLTFHKMEMRDSVNTFWFWRVQIKAEVSLCLGVT